MPTTLEYDPKLQEIVRSLRSQGFPEGQSIEDEATQDSLTTADKQLLFAAFDHFEQYGKIDDRREHGEAGLDEQWAQLRKEGRTKLQAAVMSDLLRLKWVQDIAVFFGAIPDPKDKFKFYRGAEGFYRCWNCETEVMVKPRHLSVHFRHGPPLAGSGEVKVVKQPYCPHCEQEPPSTGIIFDTDLPNRGLI